MKGDKGGKSCLKGCKDGKRTRSMDYVLGGKDGGWKGSKGDAKGGKSAKGGKHSPKGSSKGDMDGLKRDAKGSKDGFIPKGGKGDSPKGCKGGIDFGKGYKGDSKGDSGFKGCKGDSPKGSKGDGKGERFKLDEGSKGRKRMRDFDDDEFDARCGGFSKSKGKGDCCDCMKGKSKGKDEFCDCMKGYGKGCDVSKSACKGNAVDEFLSGKGKSKDDRFGCDIFDDDDFRKGKGKDDSRKGKVKDGFSSGKPRGAGKDCDFGKGKGRERFEVSDVPPSDRKGKGKSKSKGDPLFDDICDDFCAKGKGKPPFRGKSRGKNDFDFSPKGKSCKPSGKSKSKSKGKFGANFDDEFYGKSAGKCGKSKGKAHGFDIAKAKGRGKSKDDGFDVPRADGFQKAIKSSSGFCMGKGKGGKPFFDSDSDSDSDGRAISQVNYRPFDIDLGQWTFDANGTPSLRKSMPDAGAKEMCYVSTCCDSTHALSTGSDAKVASFVTRVAGEVAPLTPRRKREIELRKLYAKRKFTANRRLELARKYQTLYKAGLVKHSKQNDAVLRRGRIVVSTKVPSGREIRRSRCGKGHLPSSVVLDPAGYNISSSLGKGQGGVSRRRPSLVQ